MIEAISIFLSAVFVWFAILFVGGHIFLLIRDLVEKWKKK